MPQIKRRILQNKGLLPQYAQEHDVSGDDDQAKVPAPVFQREIHRPRARNSPSLPTLAGKTARVVPAMPDVLDRIVTAVCRMPLDFSRRGDVLMFELLKESGYLTRADEITERLIAGHMRMHPGLVDAWLGYSKDQRCTPAWCLIAESANSRSGWSVGFVAESGRLESELAFSDRYTATAYFIKQQAETLRQRDPAKHRHQDKIDGVSRALWIAYRENIAIAFAGEDFAELARRIVRRWLSSARRGVPQDDLDARIRDLAKGIAGQSSVSDYDIAAAKAAAAVL